MTPTHRAFAVPALLAVLPLLGGCVYFNGLYNARQLYQEAEDLRRAGGEAEARTRYAEAVDKAVRSYERAPTGRWADDALLLAGQAYLRQGELTRAAVVLQEALRSSSDPELRAAALLHLGVVVALSGDRERGVLMLTDALSDIGPGLLRAEGHLWRARILLSAGHVESGWWDLLRAPQEHRSLRASADLELLWWGLVHGDSARALAGAQGLLAQREGAVNADSLHALVGLARRTWGAAPAAALIAGAERAPWPPPAREGTLLLRAELHAESGNDEAARGDAGTVAAGRGPAAVRARLWLAGLELSRARTVAELDRARAILLPASSSPEALALIEGVRKVELLERRAGERAEPIALFAAAELARDELGAERLAASLFMRYADEVPGSPWAGKALLAALALAPEGGEWEAIYARSAALAGDLYVRAARGATVSAPDFEQLELALELALTALLDDVSALAMQHDVLARDRSSPSLPPEA